LSEEQDAHRINVTGQVRNAAQAAAAFRREHIHPVVAICRARLPQQPSLSKVTMPDSRLNITELVLRGRAIADAVSPFAQVFVDAGLAADFIAQLLTAGDELIKVVTRKSEHRSGRLGATDGLGKAVRKGRRTVRMLDAMVKATVPAEEPLVAEWQSAVRVIRGGGGAVAGNGATAVGTGATKEAA
jgi:hypothetical protein